MRRQRPPELPAVSQPEVVKHFIRLSQETLGADVNIGRRCRDLHDEVQPEGQRPSWSTSGGSPTSTRSRTGDTVQGVLEILWSFERILCELSGMARFSFQPGGGTQAIYTNACIIRDYHRSRGETRDEIITDGLLAPRQRRRRETAGFKVITLYPEQNGLPSLSALERPSRSAPPG